MQDRSYTFVLKTPPASKLIAKAAGIKSGSSNPQKTKVGSITEAQLREIAEIKFPDMNAVDIEGAMNSVWGTCKNMGVTVEGRVAVARVVTEAS